MTVDQGEVYVPVLPEVYLEELRAGVVSGEARAWALWQLLVCARLNDGKRVPAPGWVQALANASLGVVTNGDTSCLAEIVLSLWERGK